MEYETHWQSSKHIHMLCMYLFCKQNMTYIILRSGHDEISSDINMFNKSFSIKTTTKVGTVSDLKVQNVHLLRQK